MSLGYDHFVVTIPTQCYVYSVQQWNTPYVFDLKDTANFILQTEKYARMDIIYIITNL